MNKCTVTKILALIRITTGSPTTLLASHSDRWFLRPYIGLNLMSDLDATAINFDNTSGTARVNVDTGFTGGQGIGYRYNERFAVELAWEYRSNDAGINIADQSTLTDGNYASNIFFLNGHYHFSKKTTGSRT